MANDSLSRAGTDSGGFTLIEMLTVLTIVGILVGITVPSYVSRQITANETAAIATLKAIAQAQFQFKANGALDLDRDAGSEFGTLPELAGVAPLRGSGGTVDKRLLSAPLGMLDAQGQVSAHGYLFCLYLPDPAGKGIVANSANALLIDPDKSRNYWTCLAWPFHKGTTGERTFFVNQRGEILKTRFPVYSGKSSVPPPGAGLTGVPATNIDADSLAADSVGADGSLWLVVN